MIRSAIKARANQAYSAAQDILRTALDVPISEWLAGEDDSLKDGQSCYSMDVVGNYTRLLGTKEPAQAIDLMALALFTNCARAVAESMSGEHGPMIPGGVFTVELDWHISISSIKGDEEYPKEADEDCENPRLLMRSMMDACGIDFSGYKEDTKEGKVVSFQALQAARALREGEDNVDE